MKKENEILLMSAYKPQDRMVAEYCYEVFQAIKQTFTDSISIKVCTIERKKTNYKYSPEVKYKLLISDQKQYNNIAGQINKNDAINLLCLQYDFDLYNEAFNKNILNILYTISKPIVLTFHHITEDRRIADKNVITEMINISKKIIVTNLYDAEVLKSVFNTPYEKILVIEFTDPQDYSYNWKHNHDNEIQNSAIAYANLFKKLINERSTLKYSVSAIALDHLKNLTNHVGIIRYSKGSQPDLNSGYSLNDQAHALIALTLYNEMMLNQASPEQIDIFLQYIEVNQRPNGTFIPLRNKYGNPKLNNSNSFNQIAIGRTIWALGEFVSRAHLFSPNQIKTAEKLLERSIPIIEEFDSPKAIAFAIKGLYHYNINKKSEYIKRLIILIANNLISKYKGLNTIETEWFEDSITFENSVLPESLLYAYLETGKEIYKTVAKQSFDHLLSITFDADKIQIVSTKEFYENDHELFLFHEYPIDVSYTILALDLFLEIFNETEYWDKLEMAFSWFNGNNSLLEVMYDKTTGGCYDELKENPKNLNESAESTLTYLIARLIIEKYITTTEEKEKEEVVPEPEILVY